MDDILEWSKLTYAQQMNVLCDDLAKDAAETAIATHPAFYLPSTQQLLPHEHIVVYVDAYKQTTDPAASIRYSCSKNLAQRFLTKEMGWSMQQFE